MLTLILGGARSGKSAFAEQQAKEVAGDAVLFVATAEARDEEMRRRIERHRRLRPAAWRTVEAPRRVGQAIREHAADAQAIVVDCLTLLVSNVLAEWDDPWAEEAAEAVRDEIAELIAAAHTVKAHVFVVSNEVGFGLVPTSPLGRAYRDLLGEANCRVAAAANRVYLLIAGIPLLLRDRSVAGGEVMRHLEMLNATVGARNQGLNGEEVAALAERLVREAINEMVRAGKIAFKPE